MYRVSTAAGSACNYAFEMHDCEVLAIPIPSAWQIGWSTVVTLWPDWANRYVSVGLQPPSSGEVTCDFRTDCRARTRALLGTPE